MTIARQRTWPAAGAAVMAILPSVLSLAPPPAASAAWVASGSGGADASAAAMPTGNRPTATKPFLSSTVTVTWTASTGPGGPVTGYVVRRYSGTTPSPMASGSTCLGATVGGVANVVTTTSCKDERGVSGGTYTYRIQPVFHQWTGAESPASTPAV